jgi:hypothetical protein
MVMFFTFECICTLLKKAETRMVDNDNVAVVVVFVVTVVAAATDDDHHHHHHHRCRHRHHHHGTDDDDDKFAQNLKIFRKNRDIINGKIRKKVTKSK